jgi:hypothetical protein
MSRWLLCLVIGGVMLPANAAAQLPRLGAPMLPLVEPFPRAPEKETPAPPAAPNQPSPPATAHGDRDLFRVERGTFDPRFDRLLTPAETGMFFPTGATVWPVWSAWGSSWHEGYRRAGEVRPVEPTMRIIVEHRQAPAAVPPPPPVVTLPAATPPPPAGHKRALYVIPGCYAGDKRPRRDQLRAGCDAKDLRVISPDL